MSQFTIHTAASAGHTLLSNVFLDEYMPGANGEYLKIYLYLLRCVQGQTSLSVSAIADRFEHTEGDVLRALKYWEKLSLLQLQYDETGALTSVSLLDIPDKAAAKPVSAVSPAEPAAAFSEVSKKTEKVNTRNQYSADQMADFAAQEEIRQLLFICEQYLGKALSPTETSSILYFYDQLHFSVDLIAYLIEYCVSKGSKSMRYIETVALAWHEEGITSEKDARERTNTYNRVCFSILKAFGIKNRNPVESELRHIRRWTREYGFSLELIEEACSRTMSAIHQPSFEYTEKILAEWHKNHILHKSQLAALDAKRQQKKEPSEKTAPKKAAAPNRFHNFEQRKYTPEELEKLLIRK